MFISFMGFSAAFPFPLFHFIAVQKKVTEKDMLKHFLCALHFTPIYMQKYLIILYYKCLKGLNNKDTEGQL